MLRTRRRFLNEAALAAAAGVVRSVVPLAARAQGDADALVRRLGEDLATHASFGGKFSGGAGDLATARWVADRLRGSGYRIEESTVDLPFFVERTARLTVGSMSADVVPLPPVVVTGRDGVTAGLAVVRDQIADVSGRIALVIAPFARHAAIYADRGVGKTVTDAARAGARAVVIVTTGPSGEAVALNVPPTPFVPVPVAILAPKHAAPFVDAAESSRPATLVLDGEATERPSPNVIGRLVRGDRWIAMSTPRSGWFGCVGERGTGTAAFLALADWFTRRFSEHSVFVMNTGGHEYFFAGSHRALDQAPPAASTDVWAHIGATLAARDAEERDGRLVMLDTADPQRTLMATDAARSATAEGFAGLSGLSQPVPVRPGAGELSAFTDRGYGTAFAVIGVHRWFHTVEDTLERVDARLLAPVVRAHQTTIERLVPHS